MSSDYNRQIIIKFEGEIPMDQYGHYLDIQTIVPVEPTPLWNYRKHKPYKRMLSARKVALLNVCGSNILGKRRKFFWATELTNPYGSLNWAIGSGDDFFCFDYDFLPDNRVVLDSTINSETGSFIQEAKYEVVSQDHAPNVALSMVDEGISWAVDNDVRHTKQGWNQDPYYFYRRVFYDCDNNKNKPNFSDREFRMGGKRINAYCSLPVDMHKAIW